MKEYEITKWDHVKLRGAQIIVIIMVLWNSYRAGNHLKKYLDTHERGYLWQFLFWNALLLFIVYLFWKQRQRNKRINRYLGTSRTQIRPYDVGEDEDWRRGKEVDFISQERAKIQAEKMRKERIRDEEIK